MRGPWEGKERELITDILCAPQEERMGRFRMASDAIIITGKGEGKVTEDILLYSTSRVIISGEDRTMEEGGVTTTAIGIRGDFRGILENDERRNIPQIHFRMDIVEGYGMAALSTQGLYLIKAN